jgi:hypothetical protein
MGSWETGRKGERVRVDWANEMKIGQAGLEVQESAQSSMYTTIGYDIAYYTLHTAHEVQTVHTCIRIHTHAYVEAYSTRIDSNCSASVPTQRLTYRVQGCSSVL